MSRTIDRKHIRELRAVVGPLGLEVVPVRSGHYQLRDPRRGGRFVATVSGSPKDPDNCVRRAVADATNYLNDKENEQ